MFGSLLVAFTLQSRALPFVSPMFSDNMVLQRDMVDPVWGWTSPGAEVRVTCGDSSVKTHAGSDGKWMARIGPFKAGGPYTLTVEGPTKVSFSNILAGDVWLCSGQSNMEFGVGNLINAEQEIAAANYPNIRLFTVSHDIKAQPVPVPTSAGPWTICTPDNLRNAPDWNGFSAVAYFFGRALNQDLNVPIGLIHSSYGGTIAEAWTSRSDLMAKMPEFDGAIKAVDDAASLQSQQTYAQSLDSWYAKNDPGMSPSAPWFQPAFDDSSWKTIDLPKHFQDAGYPELVNNRSVVWFRRTVNVPEDWSGKTVSLELMADDNDATWVNGTFVGATDGWNIERSYKLPAGLLKPGPNQITVRVTDTTAPGGIWGDPKGLDLKPSDGDPISLAGAWKLHLGTVIGDGNPLPIQVGDNPNVPTVLYNGMIYPLAPMAIKGAIWYQGESNGDRGYQYRRLLPTMIGSWRTTFGEGDFPFYIVQLAGFGQAPAKPGDDQWAELREAQWMTSRDTKNVGIATAIDVGESGDIHPKNKQEVGRRLALVAEAKTYHLPRAFSGPVYRSMRVDGNKVVLAFDHTDGGLAAKGGTLKGFAVAGPDHVWSWADATIDGNKVVVSSASVAQPVAVRYSWASYYESNLYNGAGLPAFPFRTDDWMLTSQK